jgi:hypothetical protein
MSNYTIEFPDFPTADVPPVFLGPPWADHSWHNDACPSFVRVIPNGDGKEIHVYVDYADQELREYFDGVPRYIVYVSTNDGGIEDPPSLATDSLEKVLDHVGFLCGEVER